MAVNQNKLTKKIKEDKDFIKKFKSSTKTEFDKLTSSWVNRESALTQIRQRLTKEAGLWWLKTIKSAINKEASKSPVTRDLKGNLSTWITPLREDKKTEVTESPVIEEPIDEVPTETEEQRTLRERVAERVAWKKTREELLKEERAASWRWELEGLRTWFREEAAAVQTDLENIRAWLKAEWWAITSIAASRIREARSAPLREQLTSLVKGQKLTSDSLKELDQSIDGILEARRLDRQDEVSNLTNQIESSNLSDEDKNALISQLWVQTKRMEREEENEAFRQKEQIKADIEKQDQESIKKTWLTAEQNLQAATIIEDFEVKEDSIAWQSIRKLLKEWKTSDQIRQILWLAEDSTGKIDDTTFTRQEKLRKEFEANQTVKNYLESTQQFAWVISSLWAATWPWDMAAIFQFMKTLDPSSVVRESEFSSAAQSSGILDRITSLQILKKAETWELLTAKQRQQFAGIAKVLFENRKDAFDERAAKFITLAKEAWANPRSVVLDFDSIPWFATDLTDEDLAPIWNNSSDDEVINFIRNTWNTFNADSKDAELWDFLDTDDTRGLDNAELPATPKDTISFIKDLEWFSPEAFSDFKQQTSWFWTKALPWETNITEKEANKRLQTKVTEIDNKINSVFWTDLSEWQRTALTSFMFNLWTNIFAKPESQTLKNAIIDWDIETIKQQLVLFNKAWGKKLQWLVNRRKKELDLFLNS